MGRAAAAPDAGCRRESVIAAEAAVSPSPQGAPAPGRRRSRGASLLVAAVTLACLLPFSDKPLHIDDPLYVWTAKQILREPADFYGFRLNWYGVEEPMYDVMKNPPLASYWLAATGRLAGFGERALHLSFLVPSLLAALGMLSLARRLCADPLPAALCGVLTPVFVVSSTNLFSDTLMLAAWCWALRLWMRGLDERRARWLVLAALLAAVAALAKYFGAALLPLLAAYTLARERRLAPAVLWLALPTALLAGYQLATQAAYGRGLLLDAGSYVVEHRLGDLRRLGEELFVGLVFAGGSLLTALFYAPLLWGRRALAAGALAAAGLAALLPALGTLADTPLREASGPAWSLVAQLALFALAGAHLIALGLADLRERRDADALLLALMLAGTLAFAGLFNWTANARALMAAAPVTGILVARRLASRAEAARRAAAPASDGGRSALARFAPLVPAALLVLALASADARLAHSVRDAAVTLAARHAGPDRTLWFQGHWGFQYYLEQAGARAVDFAASRLAAGDVLLEAENTSGKVAVPADSVALLQELALPAARGVTTMSVRTGAGFYSSVWGPLPFRVGAVPEERYRAWRVVRPLRGVDGRLVPDR